MIDQQFLGNKLENDLAMQHASRFSCGERILATWQLE